MHVTELQNTYLSQLELMATTDEKRAAINQLKHSGLPTTKWENWKYSQVSQYLPPRLERPSVSSLERDLQAPLEQVGPFVHQIVLRNGHYIASLSRLPAGLNIEKMAAQAQVNSGPTAVFKALNDIMNEEGINLRLQAHTQLSSPVAIIHLASVENRGQTLSPQIYIAAESQSQATIVEYFFAENHLAEKYFRNSQTSLLLESGAHLTHLKAQCESAHATHISSVVANLERDAHFTSFTLSLGGQFGRNEVEVNLLDHGAHGEVHGLYALKEEQHHDNFTTIHHLKSHTSSHQLFKGILDDQAHGIFTGKIHIHRDAQQVNSTQLNKNLLLSKKAHVHTRPQLEVYADDVKCSHGATIGQLNDDEIFYLESRGIKKERASQILCHAFLSEATAKIEDEATRRWAEKLVFEHFEKVTLEKFLNHSHGEKI